MNPITITVTGRLGDDPRQFATRDGTPGVELRLAVDLGSRVPGGTVTTLAESGYIEGCGQVCPGCFGAPVLPWLNDSELPF